MDPGMAMGSIVGSMARGAAMCLPWGAQARAVLQCADLPLALSLGIRRTDDEAAPARFVVGGAYTTWLLPARWRALRHKSRAL